MQEHHGATIATDEVLLSNAWAFARPPRAEQTKSAAPESNTQTPVTLVVEGSYAYWECIAQCGSSRCSVRCTDRRGVAHYGVSLWREVSDPAGDSAPAADTEQFNRAPDATGLTASIDDTVATVEAWMQGTSQVQLFDRFPFVAQSQRTLERLQQEITTLRSPLGELAKFRPQNYGYDSSLSFTQGERACKCSFSLQDQRSTVHFLWQNHELFSCSVDTPEAVAAPIERWVCDQMMPSQMQREFPDLEIGEIAHYYERDEMWVVACLDSWRITEAFYRDGFGEPDAEMLRLIAQMRAHGYDKSLRAGHHFWGPFVLSRSKKHGLREGQPSLRFTFHGQSRGLRINVNSGPPIPFATRDLTPEIEALLQQLEAHEID